MHYTDRDWHAEFLNYRPASWTEPAPVRAQQRRSIWASLFYFFTR